MSTLRVDNLKGKTTDLAVNVFASHNSGTTTTNLEQGLAKAWGDFDATGTPHADDSFNFSSVTDVAAAKFDAAFTNNMASVNYAGASMAGDAGASDDDNHSVKYNYPDTKKLTTGVGLIAGSDDGAYNEFTDVGYIQMGDLA